mmetsp:Transcript_15461/g.22671  ORF Transcript_15461/g.22671 Transcript_15461/m.22671 type:complete len:88 (+) Transcript_15461:1-264(+)
MKDSLMKASQPLRRGLATGLRTKDEKAALIMRLRAREEESKKYGAPLGQAVVIGACGLMALACGGYGWATMDPRMGSMRSRISAPSR